MKKFKEYFEMKLNESHDNIVKKINSIGKLTYNDIIKLIRKDISLSKSLGKDLGKDVDFSHLSLYDVKSGKTILSDALDGKYTYDEILDSAKKFYA